MIRIILIMQNIIQAVLATNAEKILKVYVVFIDAILANGTAVKIVIMIFLCGG